MNRRRSGFTLVEVLIVVAILLLVVSMTAKGLLTCRLSANETAAAGALKTIHAATELYRQTFGSYPSGMRDLTAAGGADPAYIIDALDSSTTGAPRSGYRFLYFPYQQMGGRPVDAYFVIAGPARLGITGRRLFYIDEDGVVRASSGGGFSGRPGARGWPAFSGG